MPLYSTGGKMITAFSVTFLAYEWQACR
ncbi:hypothetical protein [Sodalis glossinidius]